MAENHIAFEHRVHEDGREHGDKQHAEGAFGAKRRFPGNKQREGADPDKGIEQIGHDAQQGKHEICRPLPGNAHQIALAGKHFLCFFPVVGDQAQDEEECGKPGQNTKNFMAFWNGRAFGCCFVRNFYFSYRGLGDSLFRHF